MQAPLVKSREAMKQSSKINRNPAVPAESPGQSPLRLILMLTDGGTPPQFIAARLNKERLVAGRAGNSSDAPASPLIPDLDFTPLNALENGVSRQHAAFIYKEGALSLEDLNSTNGTRINGFQIVPGQLYRLRNGDELEFGRLRTIIRVVRSPH